MGCRQVMEEESKPLAVISGRSGRCIFYKANYFVVCQTSLIFCIHGKAVTLKEDGKSKPQQKAFLTWGRQSVPPLPVNHSMHAVKKASICQERNQSNCLTSNICHIHVFVFGKHLLTETSVHFPKHNICACVWGEKKGL